MKPTVDLTEDRMFPDIKVSRGPSWLIGDTKHFITSDEEFVDWRFQISGSAEEYRRREEWRKADSLDYCDRCGKRIVTPWRWDRSLCEECNVALYNDLYYKKVPWDSDSFWSEITV